ncbi:MAG: hypothetical protein AMXMBFR12_10420 [Candidatus Babeliales bacterium]
MEKKETLPSFAELIASIGNPELITVMPAQPSNNSLQIPIPHREIAPSVIRTKRKHKTPAPRGPHQFNFSQFPENEKHFQPSGIQFPSAKRKYIKK